MCRCPVRTRAPAPMSRLARAHTMRERHGVCGAHLVKARPHAARACTLVKLEYRSRPARAIRGLPTNNGLLKSAQIGLRHVQHRVGRHRREAVGADVRRVLQLRGGGKVGAQQCRDSAVAGAGRGSSRAKEDDASRPSLPEALLSGGAAVCAGGSIRAGIRQWSVEQQHGSRARRGRRR